MFVPAAVGAVDVSEERRKHPADDVREAGALGLHLPELRLHQQGAGPDEVGQWEAAGGGEPGAVLRTLHLQRQVSKLVSGIIQLISTQFIWCCIQGSFRLTDVWD